MSPDLDIAKLRDAAEQGAAEGHAVEVDAPTLLALIADLEAAEAKLERHGDLFVRVGQSYRKLRKCNAKCEAALRPVVQALGDHYCGVCGNSGAFGVEQPYSDVTDPEMETCSGCRHNYDAYRAGLKALKENTDEGGESAPEEVG